MSRRRRNKLIMAKKTEGPQPEPEVKNAIIANAEPKHKVTVIRDSALEFPQLYLEVFFSEEGHEAGFAEMFSKAGCSLADSLEHADLIVFPGGADVNPKLYGADRHAQTRTSPERDDREMLIYAEALRLGIPMVGVCRGAQFLHVMQGGELYQHVDNHHSAHKMFDVEQKMFFDRVPSTHHQMIKKSDSINMQVFAYAAGVSTQRYTGPLTLTRGQDFDVEGVFYPNACALGVQGHPEYRGYSKYTQWFLKLIEDKIVNNTRVFSEQGDDKHSNYRFRPKVDVVIN